MADGVTKAGPVEEDVMTHRDCPHCGSTRATTIMLPPTRGTHETRPHPAFRCLVCDTQWADDEQWTRLHEGRGAETAS
jgi:hypothetical protein